MGQFVEGEWKPGFYGSDSQGRFLRPATTFREQLSPDQVEAGRFHLYVSYACPWAHRTLLARSLLGLEGVVSMSPVDWLLTDEGWSFSSQHPDPLHGCSWLREVYLRADQRYTGRVTVPVLWDRHRQTIVNNESREILRMLCSVFVSECELSPPALRPAIDAMIDRLYPSVNNGVYRCGFASSQAAYDEALAELFKALDQLDELLGSQPFLCGERPSEADLCLFTTLLRFDAVYFVHFKCSRQRIADYARLSGYLRSLYQWPGVAPTCRFDHIRNHYYQSHRHINPSGIVAASPVWDLNAPHGRY